MCAHKLDVAIFTASEKFIDRFAVVVEENRFAVVTEEDRFEVVAGEDPFAVVSDKDRFAAASDEYRSAAGSVKDSSAAAAESDPVAVVSARCLPADNCPAEIEEALSGWSMDRRTGNALILPYAAKSAGVTACHVFPPPCVRCAPDPAPGGRLP